MTTLSSRKTSPNGCRRKRRRTGPRLLGALTRPRSPSSLRAWLPALFEARQQLDLALGGFGDELLPLGAGELAGFGVALDLVTKVRLVTEQAHLRRIQGRAAGPAAD